MCTQVANDKRPMQGADEGDLNAPTMQEMKHLVYRLFIEAARRARQAAPVRPALTKAKKEAQDQHLLDVLFVVLLVALPPSRTQVLRTLRIGMSDKSHGNGSVDPPNTHRSWIAWVAEDSVYSIEVPKQKTGRSEDNRVPPEVTEYISDIITIVGVKKAGYPSPFVTLSPSPSPSLMLHPYPYPCLYPYPYFPTPIP